jgi:hypothetical protein
MNMTVVLFQIGFDRFSALAINLNDQKQIWKKRFDSFQELIRSLRQAGAVTAADAEAMQEESWFDEGAPILRVSMDREHIESAGFERVLS